MNVSRVVNFWIEKALKLPFRIEEELIQDENKDGACLRTDPAPAAEQRFIDGSRLVSWLYTYYIRCKEGPRAMAYCYDITNRLDGETIIDKETETKIEVEAKTLPQFVEKDEKDYSTYSAAVICTYYEEEIHDGK